MPQELNEHKECSQEVVATKPIDWKLWRPRIIYFLVVACLGFILMNQLFQYYYAAQLLQAPCNLCVKLNPEVKGCMMETKSKFQDSKGEWKSLDEQYLKNEIEKIKINYSLVD